MNCVPDDFIATSVLLLLSPFSGKSKKSRILEKNTFKKIINIIITNSNSTNTITPLSLYIWIFLLALLRILSKVNIFLLLFYPISKTVWELLAILWFSVASGLAYVSFCEKNEYIQKYFQNGRMKIFEILLLHKSNKNTGKNCLTHLFQNFEN